jgi:hypothetical protein
VSAGDYPAEVGKADALADLQPERPGDDPQGDLAVDPGDLDGLVLRQPMAREERSEPDNGFAGPGEGETPLDQDLATVGGGNRAIAAELDAVERVATS